MQARRQSEWRDPRLRATSLARYPLRQSRSSGPAVAGVAVPAAVATATTVVGAASVLFLSWPHRGRPRECIASALPSHESLPRVREERQASQTEERPGEWSRHGGELHGAQASQSRRQEAREDAQPLVKERVAHGYFRR